MSVRHAFMTVRRCVLHIGTEKTGTSSIQHFLRTNRAALLERGVLVPEALGVPSHIKLATYAMDDDKVDDIRMLAGVSEPAQVPHHRAEVAAALAAELAEAEVRVHTTLLSGEHCHSRLTSEEEVERLALLLRGHFDEIRVLVYLRAQVEMAVSLYSTALKCGWTYEQVLPAISQPTPYYDYASLLERWAQAFGRAAMEVRTFEPQALIGRDICRDYADAVGLDPAGLTQVPRVNETLGDRAQLFLREMNERLPVFIDGRPNPARGRLTELVERGRTGVGMRPSREEAIRFMEVFAEGNEKVRASWFPDRDALFTMRDDWPERGDQVEPLTLDEVFDMFAEVWGALNTEASG